MSRRSKLLARILARPTEMDFEEVRRVLEMFDYRMREGGSGSHRVFVGPSGDEVTIPVKQGRKVKRFYIKRVIDVLDLVSYLENES